VPRARRGAQRCGAEPGPIRPRVITVRAHSSIRFAN
jgi:hypothetical protein